MNEEIKNDLQKELLESWGVVKEYLAMGKDFAAEQTPLVIEELVKFNLWYSGMIIGIFIFSFILWIGSTLLCIYFTDKHSDAAGWPFFIGGVFSAVTFIMALGQVKPFIMCLTAPRLFVIEYVKNML
jgi:hypothetical protein